MKKRLVTLILLVLAVGMAVPTSRAWIVDQLRPIKDNVGERLVPRRLDAMANQLDVRLSRAEGLPTNFPAWLGRDYSGVAEDPWGNTYYIQTGRRDYTVGSMGADGLQGTEDDIQVTRPLPGGR